MSYVPKATTVELLETLGLQAHIPRIENETHELYSILDACERLRDKRLVSFADRVYLHWNPVADAELVCAMKHSLIDQGENAAANALANVLILCGERDESLVPHLAPWYQVPFRWRDKNYSVGGIFAALEAHGFSTRTEESAFLITELLFDPFLAALNNDGGYKIRDALFGSRVIRCRLEDLCYTPAHDEILAKFAAGAVPPVPITGVSQNQVTDERYRNIRDEVAITTIGPDGTQRCVNIATEMPDVVAVVEIAEGAAWEVEYSCENELHIFHTRDLGCYADVEAVTREFNGLMAKKGRTDRVFRIDPPPIDKCEFFGDFIVADETKFRHLADFLSFPLPK